MATDVVVLGGGFAGMAAAISLARSGAQVLLIEKKKFLGGRVYSIRNRHTGDWIDNGQHALMGCYHRTFDLLRELGTVDGVTLQPNISVPYRGSDGLRDHLRGFPLPGPLHLLCGLLSMRSLSWREKLSAVNFGLQMKRTHAVREGETVAQLCRRLGQSPALQQRMWDSIALSALNEETALADASLLQTVLRQAFFSTASDSRMGLATVPLQQLHGEAFIEYLRARRGCVRLESRVDRLETQGENVVAVVMSNGERVPCGGCISALPAPAASRMMQASGLAERIAIPDLGESPILSVYLWFDVPLSEEMFCCLQDCTYEWIFHRSNFMNAGEHTSYCVCLLVSAARRLQSLGRDALVKAAIEDIHKTYPECGKPIPTESAVFWEPRATFSATPENHRKRLAAQTPLSNLFLAGDWTATDLPATIEGAVVSGNQAANAIQFG